MNLRKSAARASSRTLKMTEDFELPAGMRLYVIGDIHGRSDLLDQILEVIYRDIEKHGRRESLTITLGDYIDRGPDSRGPTCR